MNYEDLVEQVNHLKMEMRKMNDNAKAKHDQLKKKIAEQNTQLYALQSHFQTVKLCLDVYIDNSKHIKTDYKTVSNKFAEIANSLTILFQYMEKTQAHEERLAIVESKIEHSSVNNLEISNIPLFSTPDFESSTFENMSPFFLE
jgi:chromosome segregation ATPase